MVSRRFTSVILNNIKRSASYAEPSHSIKRTDLNYEILTRLALLCGVASLMLTSSAEAVECVYRGVDTDARVVRDSGEMFLPTNWISDTKCERLAITSGSVRIVSRNSD